MAELRTFDPIPQVAYVDNENDAVHLCQEMEGKTSGIYVSVQPRPAHLFDLAPNCWRHAQATPNTNCACDKDVEYITACFWDIDVVSECRQLGHPAMYALGYTAGLRFGEMFSLMWSNIDFETGEVIVENRPATPKILPFFVKDYETRRIPLPKHTLSMLTKLHAEAPERIPFVLLDERRYQTVLAK